jgi:hypothetical protein
LSTREFGILGNLGCLCQSQIPPLVLPTTTSDLTRKGGIRYEEQESQKNYFLIAKSLMNLNLKKEEWTKCVTNVLLLMVVKQNSLICYMLLIIIWVSYKSPLQEFKTSTIITQVV